MLRISSTEKVMSAVCSDSPLCNRRGSGFGFGIDLRVMFPCSSVVREDNRAPGAIRVVESCPMPGILNAK